MMIYKNSKKGGFALGRNHLTKSNLIAGGVAAVGVVLAALIGFSSPKKKDKRSQSRKKRRLLDVTALTPLAFKLTKAVASNIELDKIVNEVTKTAQDGGYDIEVINATPISSEEEVYEYIEENGL